MPTMRQESEPTVALVTDYGTPAQRAHRTIPGRRYDAPVYVRHARALQEKYPEATVYLVFHDPMLGSSTVQKVPR